MSDMKHNLSIKGTIITDNTAITISKTPNDISIWPSSIAIESIAPINPATIPTTMNNA